MKPVTVLYQDQTGYHFKECTCLGVPTSTVPEDYGLRSDAVVILVLANFRGANAYLLGNLTMEAF